MSGEDSDTRQTLVTHIKPMLVPRSVGAPAFDGHYVHNFLSTVKILGKNAGLTSAELPKHILPYCTDTIKRSIEWADEFNGTNWEAVKVFLIEIYESSEQGPMVSIDQLQTYIRESKDFLTIAGQLKKRGIMDKKEMELKFVEGLPKGFRAFVSSQLPSENKVTTKPPSISQVIKIINCRFDSNCLEFLELDEVVDDEMLPPTKPLFIPSNAAIDSSFSQTLTVKPKSDIEALAQQLKQLTINQAQIFTALQSLSVRPSNSMTNTGRCFICGLTASVGGVAAHLCQQASTKTVSTSNILLMFSASQALGGQIIGISAEDYNQYLGSAVMRTGCDTSNCVVKKGPTNIPASVQIPATNPPLKPQVSIPLPPLINTREGWKDSHGNRDVTMKDDLKKGPQFHFMSDIQEQASVENIEHFILDQMVSLSLCNILGVSPALQKRIQELTKTCCEYVMKTSEYDLYSLEAEQLLSQNHTASTSEAQLSHKTLYVPETNEFQTFLV
ncbi:hypothetical protein M422DRAFT_252974 [Sphaerobolus stellatus SS14]|uniref:DUF4100 domain-containing protein n=1 Tax=Sphaerobolus stellatus (strain SS14) TaxID=990650 RepID=A0A0C9VYX2_SPHS4|nr:hypothetical protein M422DRAFT_252974 [Sphaerobolus stellatus SS14]